MRIADVLHEEIARQGPISFERFMDVALYHPWLGYYRRGRDPFGRSGDYFTAEQLQPVFGRLVASAVADLHRQLGEPSDFMVVELGAGRGEMAEALSRFRYVPVEFGRDQLPEHFTGVILASEFFDALPVRLVRQGRDVLVGSRGERFEFVDGEPAAGDTRQYLDRFAPDAATVEVHLRMLDWIRRIAAGLERGFLLTIDYGYTARELTRFPEGTLMSYHRHTASEDVLADPGERDITSHVPFHVLQEAGADSGLATVRFETLTQFLLRAGEADGFASAVAGGHELQLKTLLAGMGESFRVLLHGGAGCQPAAD